MSLPPSNPLCIELLPGVNSIGRQDKGNRVVLVSPAVSRFHAEIIVADDGITVTDLGSANGTFVNGRRVSQAGLRPGDQVAFSDVFSFRLEVVAAEAAPQGAMAPPSGDDIWAGLPSATTPAPNPRPTDDVQYKRTGPLLGDGQVFAHGILDMGDVTIPPLSDGQPRASEVAEPGRAGEPSSVSGLGSGASHATVEPAAAPIAPTDTDAMGTPAFDEPETRAATTDASVASNGPTTAWSGSISVSGAEVRDIEDDASEPSDGLETLEGGGLQLAAILEYQDRASRVTDLHELERAMVHVIEELLLCDRGFVTYRLPNGDWKLLMLARPFNWERRQVRDLLVLARARGASVLVSSSREDSTLGPSERPQGDARVLVPLHRDGHNLGALFLVAALPGSIDVEIQRMLDYMAGITCQALLRLGKP